jgi:glyceraldehyde 3-phosphate dehydrogenase
LPELQGKMNGSAIRVPTANVSIVDLAVTASRDTSLEEVNQAFRDAASGPMKNVLGINERPLVSIDFNHDPHSAIADLTQTNVTCNRFVRVLSWYDNEWGFSCRMLDTAAAMAKYL